jgi:hypothetical protein
MGGKEVTTSPWTKQLVSKIAMDIGKEVVHRCETMYPKAFEVTPKTFRLHIRNCVHNEIMAAIQVNEEGEIIARMDARKKHRRKINAIYKKIRSKP